MELNGSASPLYSENVYYEYYDYITNIFVFVYHGFLFLLMQM